jgi:tRNA A22 N-methylase
VFNIILTLQQLQEDLEKQLSSPDNTFELLEDVLVNERSRFYSILHISSMLTFGQLQS